MIYKEIILAFQQFTKPNAIVDETNMQSKPILLILRNLEEVAISLNIGNLEYGKLSFN
jgi:hypothetical protein